MEGVRVVVCHLVRENLRDPTLVHRRVHRVLIISHRLPRVGAIIGTLLQIFVIVPGDEAISVRAHSLLLQTGAVLGGATVVHAERVVNLAQSFKPGLLLHCA